MNLFTIDFLDIFVDYLVFFLMLIIIVAGFVFYRALNILSKIDDDVPDENRVNNHLFEIERKLEDIESKQEEHNLKINFIYSKCIDIWQDQHDKGRQSKKN